MAENRVLTGGRDDLIIDTSRCLWMRFCYSSCRRCVDICPHGAVTLEGGLAVNAELCRGCLLCTSVCPAGALEPNSDFSACLAKLSRVPEPILGCVRTTECSNATLACLGGLSEEHLLTLSHIITGSVTLNLSHCSDCPNILMAVTLKQRLAALSEAGLTSGFSRIVIAESPADICYRDQSLDRRGFFTSLRSSLFSSAAVILAPHNEVTDRRSEYAGKRIPTRRVLLNGVREGAPNDLRAGIQKRFDTTITIDGNCTACHACIAICPTGALLAEQPDAPPTFDRLLCTGCGLCPEFCLENALFMDPKHVP